MWEFYVSRAFSSPDLAEFLSRYPTILRTSLEKQLVPSLDFFSNLLQSDDKTVRVLQRCPFILGYDLDAYMLPNIKTLLDNGVPKSNIISAVCYHPAAFLTYSDRFKEIVKKVNEMGSIL